MPWCTITARISVGAFELMPLGLAGLEGDLRDAVYSVLRPYGKSRNVDLATVPILRRVGASLTADLRDDELGALFEFRERFAFAVLAHRQFFGSHHRYANSENIRLVVQRFTYEGAGGAMITSRRRDGSAHNIMPKGSLRLMRPQHASSSCEIPRDVDLALLEALERAEASELAIWPQVADAVRLFVGANSDSPDVALHTELIDVISAFSRLADSHKTPRIVRAFVDTLPSPAPHWMEADPRFAGPGWGPRKTWRRIVEQIKRGSSYREIWLNDACLLRNEVGHGKVTTRSREPVWALHEHLLLAAVALPLYVKTVLANAGVYTRTEEDDELDSVFDVLTTLKPFAWTDDPLVDEAANRRTHSDVSPWRRVMTNASLRRMARRLYPSHRTAEE